MNTYVKYAVVIVAYNREDLYPELTAYVNVTRKARSNFIKNSLLPLRRISVRLYMELLLYDIMDIIYVVVNGDKGMESWA